MGQHKMNPFANGTTVSRAMRARDAFNRRLVEGDEVILNGLKLPDNPRYLVSQIIPNLAPNAPPNTVKVMVTQQIMIVIAADTPFEGLWRIRTGMELAEAAGKTPVLPPADDAGDDDTVDLGKIAED